MRCEHQWLPVMTVEVDFDALADAATREQAEQIAQDTRFVMDDRRACSKCGRREPRPKRTPMTGMV